MYKYFHKEDKRANLVVLPYAGGSSLGFSQWGNEFKDDIDLILVDYSGHGIRKREPLLDDFQMMVDDIVEQLNDIYISETFIFGHSMGGLIAAYVAKEIYNRKGQNFKGIMISCCKAPDLFENNKGKPINEIELIEYLKNERHVPQDVIESKEFIHELLPVVKNDFGLIRKYEYTELSIPACPIYCICAINDRDVSLEEMQNWKRYTDNNITFYTVPGTHFYFEEHPQDTFELIRKIIYEP